MNREIKRLYERFIHTRGQPPTDAAGVEASITEFVSVLEHDLIRAFYLNEFRGLSVNVPDSVQQIKKLLVNVSDLKNSILIAMRDKPYVLGEDVNQNLEMDRSFYELSQHEIINDLQETPNLEILQKLCEEYDVQILRTRIEENEANARHFDKIYHQMLKDFINFVDEAESLYYGEEENKDPSVRDKKLTLVLMKALPLIYRLFRRGEVGIELIRLVQSGYYSYLCYIEIIDKEHEEFDLHLRNGMSISQIDLLHDRRLIKTELFISLRKAGMKSLESELLNRAKLYEMLNHFYKQKWIDTPNLETVLVNAISQPAIKLLQSMEGFRIKKELWRDMIPYLKKDANSTELIKKLGELIKNPSWLKPLNDAWQKAIHQEEGRPAYIQLDMVVAMVEQYHEQMTKNPTGFSQVERFRQMRDRIIAKPDSMLAPAPEAKKEITESTESSNAIEQTAPEAVEPQQEAPEAVKPQQESPAPEAVSQPKESGQARSPLTVMNDLLQAMRDRLENAEQAHNMMTELSYTPQQSLDFLKDHQVLAPQSKTQLLERLSSFEDRMKSNDPAILPRLKPNFERLQQTVEVQLQLDTLRQQRKNLMAAQQPAWNLTESESQLLAGNNIPLLQKLENERSIYYKYQAIANIAQQLKNKKLLASLRQGSSTAVQVVNPVLIANPNLFTGKQLEHMLAGLHSLKSDKVEAVGKDLLELVESERSSTVIVHLAQCGLFNLQNDFRQEYLQQLQAYFKKTESYSDEKFKQLKGQKIDKGNLKQIAELLSKLPKDLTSRRTKALNEQILGLLKGKEGAQPINQEERAFLVDSLTTNHYIMLIDEFVQCLLKIHDKAGANSDANFSPQTIHAKLIKLKDIDFFDQRLEILLDIAQSLYGSPSAVTDYGKKLYKQLTGFDY